MDSPHPKSIGRYRILSPLGEGATAVAYRAVDPVSDGLVTLKVIGASGSTGADQLRREFLTTATCAEDSREFDFGEDHLLKCWFFVRPFIAGEDLATFLRHASASDRLRCLALSAAELQRIHRRGYIHGDIKPQHVLVRRVHRDDLQVHLIDLGLCMRGNEPSKARGTPLFADPRVLKGHVPDERSDLYSLARSFMEYPFEGPGRRPQVELERRILLHMTNEDPELRPRSTEQVLAMLESEVGSGRSNPVLSSSWVGQESMLSALDLPADSSLGSHGWFLVRGAPGSGKSRLLEKLRLEWSARALRVFRVKLSDTALRGDPPLHRLALEVELEWQWRQPAGAAAVTGWSAARFDVGLAQSPHSGVRALVDRLSALAAVQPIALLVDDLHNADPVSLDWVRACLWGRFCRVVVTELASRSHQGAALCASFGGTPLVLDPLPIESVHRLAKARAPTLSDQRLEVVTRLAEGSPRWVEVLADTLCGLAESDPPEEVETVARRRMAVDARRDLVLQLRRLLPTQRRALVRLGCLASTFLDSTAAALLEQQPSATIRIIEELCATGLLLKVPGLRPARYRIVSELVRSHLLSRNDPGSTVALHANCARVLLREEPDNVVEIAERALQGGATEILAQVIVAALERLLEQDGITRLDEFAGAGLRLPVASTVRAGIRSVWSRACFRSGRHQEALVLLDANRDSGDEDSLHTDVRLQDGMRRAACLESSLDLDGALHILESIESVARTGDRAAALARILNAKGRVLWKAKKADVARASFAEGLGLLQGKNADTMGDIHLSQGMVLRMTGWITESTREFQRAVECARAAGNLNLEGQALNNLSMTHLQCGNSAGAVACLQEAVRVRTLIGDQRGTSFLLNRLGECELFAGNFGNAMEALGRSDVLANLLHIKEAHQTSLLLQARIWMEKGDFRRCRQLLSDANALEGGALEAQYQVSRCLLAMDCDITLGRFDAALELGRTAEQVAKAANLESQALILRTSAAEALFWSGRRGEGIALAKCCAEELSRIGYLANALYAQSLLTEFLILQGCSDRFGPAVESLGVLVRSCDLRLLQIQARIVISRVLLLIERVPEASRILLEAARDAEKLGLAESMWRACAGLGELHRRGRRWERAVHWSSRAVQVFRAAVENLGDPELESSYLSHPARAIVLDQLADSLAELRT